MKFKATHGHGASGLHPEARSKTYRAWESMKARCNNPKHSSYSRYGALGVAVCESWGTFDDFLRDMGEVPPGMTLERKDNALGYSATNCCWATPLQQSNNRTNNIVVEVDGARLTLSQAARLKGVSYSLVHCRIQKGWDPQVAFDTPRSRTTKRTPLVVNVDGKIAIVDDYARQVGPGSTL